MTLQNCFLNTADKSACSGCSACASACSHYAITMQEDAEGFLYPVIDANRCIHCGLCERLCPINNNGNTSNNGNAPRAFLAYSEHQEFYLASATIGVCTMLAQYVIGAGGLVYGVSLDEKDWHARHVCVSDRGGIENIRNSKYLQSETGDTFTQVKDHLSAGKSVLFIGTPCQVAGLKSFLRKDYETLLTIDIICHGIYSYKLIVKEVEYWQRKLRGKVSNFKFRSKRIYPWYKGGVINFDLKRFWGTRHYEIPGPLSPTYRCYAYSDDGINYNLRQSCYACAFRNKVRYGDITVGDAWFVDTKKYLGDKPNRWNGISLIFCNNTRGKKYFDSVSHLLHVTEITLADAFRQPALLPADRPIPEARTALYQAISTTEDYAHIIQRILHYDIEQAYRKAFGPKLRFPSIKRLLTLLHR